MDSDGANVTRLTELLAGQPACSPDGSRILFVGPSIEKIGGSKPPEVFVVDSNGKNVRMLTSYPVPTAEPSWSHDGATIVFIKTVDRMAARANVFQMDSAGGNLKRLTAGPSGDRGPALSPDGSKLLFQSNRTGNYEIYVKSLH
jgi:TolB protein